MALTLMRALTLSSVAERVLDAVLPRHVRLAAYDRRTAEMLERRIAAAQAAGESDTVASLRRDLEYHHQSVSADNDERFSTRLLAEAHRLRVPLPAWDYDKTDVDVCWDISRYTGRAHLTKHGQHLVRKEIRAEKEARHKERALWLPWIGGLAALFGAATGFLVVLDRLLRS